MLRKDRINFRFKTPDARLSASVCVAPAQSQGVTLFSFSLYERCCSIRFCAFSSFRLASCCCSRKSRGLFGPAICPFFKPCWRERVGERPMGLDGSYNPVPARILSGKFVDPIARCCLHADREVSFRVCVVFHWGKVLHVKRGNNE